MHEYAARVVRVIDGDTIVVDIDVGFCFWLHGQRIRLRGIDAPEVTGPTKIDGQAARLWLRERIEGAWVILRTHDGGAESDNFGRWLADVYLGGESINDALVQAGHARPAVFSQELLDESH